MRIFSILTSIFFFVFSILIVIGFGNLAYSYVMSGINSFDTSNWQASVKMIANGAIFGFVSILVFIFALIGLINGIKRNGHLKAFSMFASIFVIYLLAYAYINLDFEHISQNFIILMIFAVSGIVLQIVFKSLAKKNKMVGIIVLGVLMITHLLALVIFGYLKKLYSFDDMLYLIKNFSTLKDNLQDALAVVSLYILLEYVFFYALYGMILLIPYVLLKVFECVRAAKANNPRLTPMAPRTQDILPEPEPQPKPVTSNSSPKARFCIFCGQPLSGNGKFCSNCGGKQE